MRERARGTKAVELLAKNFTVEVRTLGVPNER